MRVTEHGMMVNASTGDKHELAGRATDRSQREARSRVGRVGSCRCRSTSVGRGTVSTHDLLQPLARLHITYRAYDLYTGELLAKLLLDVVEREFTMVQQHQLAGKKACDLPADFRSD